MGRYVTKPFEIEAVQYNHGENLTEVQVFTKDQFRVVFNDGDVVAEVYDDVQHTWVGVKDGDWIIKGMVGEFYPCDPKVFRAKYEEAGKYQKRPELSNHDIVVYVINNASDPEKVAADVIKKIRSKSAGRR